jgi:carboxypeptidase T
MKTTPKKYIFSFKLYAVCTILCIGIFSGCITARQDRSLPEVSEMVLLPVLPVDHPAVLPNWVDGEYHDYEGTMRKLFAFDKTYPSLVRVFTIGKSVQGRDLWCVCITNEDNTTRKYSCLIDGCIHGNEWEGGEACLYSAEFLLMNFGKNNTITTILNTTAMYLIPLVNPDGRAYDDRFNANGIDLNRNYDVNFGRILGRNLPVGKMFGIIKWLGIPKTGFVLTKAGWHPFSEPESQALGRFMEQLKNQDFSFYVTCHTAVHCFAAPSYVVRRSDYTLNETEIGVFEFAKSWVENHTEYQASKNQDHHGMGDSMAWCFKEFHIPSFTFELLTPDYDPWFGHGKHDHLVHWMGTTLPVFLYLLINIQNLHGWRIPDCQPPLI